MQDLGVSKRTALLVSEPQRTRTRIAPLLTQYSLVAAVLCGFALRAAAILVKHTYRIKPDLLSGEAYFQFGYETGRIAASIASGYGFANPFHGITGPTAWLAPVYPYLTAAVFRVFGIYTDSSALVLLLLNSLFSALTCIPIFLIARDVCGARVARWSAWAWALLPTAMFWGIRWIWDTTLSTLLLTVALWLTLRLEYTNRWHTWLAWTTTWAALALTNPSCCSVLVIAGVWLCYRRSQRHAPWRNRMALSTLLFLALLTPWEVRNYITFHKFVPIRDNLGAEIRMGNGPGASGLWMEWAHPTQNVAQLARYRRAGETAYIAQKKAEALDFIRENPQRFVALSISRLIYFWVGPPKSGDNAALGILHNWPFITLSVLSLLGLLYAVARKRPNAVLFLAITTLYPAVYYVTFPDPRYRHPIEPVLVIFAAYLLSESREFRKAESSEKVIEISSQPLPVSAD